MAWLSRLLGGRPATRLTAEQAVDLAAARAQHAGFPFAGGTADATKVAGRAVWHAHSATKDAGWTATVDDATGEVTELRLQAVPLGRTP